jgi:cytochrome c oxidase subunit 2
MALFEALRCNTCHEAGPTQRGPSLVGVAGHEVRFADGGSAVADDGYLRESILEPSRRITAGYEPLMPTYKGQVSEEEVLLLLAYIKSLAPAQGREPGGAPK